MNFTVVGAFVLTLGTLLIAGVLWLAAGGATRSAEDLYLAIEDESVAGLNLNAPVKYNGVDVAIAPRFIETEKSWPGRVSFWERARALALWNRARFRFTGVRGAVGTRAPCPPVPARHQTSSGLGISAGDITGGTRPIVQSEPSNQSLPCSALIDIGDDFPARPRETARGSNRRV